MGLIATDIFMSQNFGEPAMRFMHEASVLYPEQRNGTTFYCGLKVCPPKTFTLKTLPTIVIIKGVALRLL